MSGGGLFDEAIGEVLIVSQSEGLGQTNNHNQHNKGLQKGEWWCASAVPERFCYGEGDASTQKG